MTAVAAGTSVEDLILKARAYSLCARILAETERPPGRADAARELRGVLDRLGEQTGQLDADAFATPAGAPPRRIPEFLKPLATGVVSPYETSYEPPPGVNGTQTFRLADIAGFYRAFGLQAGGERPDHIVPELEFLALLCAKEAHAKISGNDEAAGVCVDARRAFLRDHLGAWLPQFSLAVAEKLPGSPLIPLTEVIAQLNA